MTIHHIHGSSGDGADVSEELRLAKEEAEKARKKAEELAQFPLYDPSPLIRFDLGTRALLFVNPAAFNKYSDIFKKGADHPLLAEIQVPAAQAFRERRTITREVVVGTTTYQQAITPNLLGQEQIITVYSHDITRLKVTEETLRSETERAEAASRAKSDFLANMSHELRTPRTGVLGMAGLLKETPISPEQRELVDTIYNSGESLLLLLNDILDLSKIEASELTLEEIPFNLRVLMNDTVKLLDPLAKKKEIALEYNYNKAAPDSIVGDPARLRQIVTNLIGNALKFTSKGSVKLDISSRRLEDGRAQLFFRVDDTGIGIKEQNLQKIFNKFTQADESTTRRYGGTGLGLTICKLLVEAMGGKIGVESTVGKGASFWFEIPTKIASVEQTVRLSEVNKGGSIMNGSQQVDFSKARVIVVDDHPVNLFFAKKLLTKFGFRTVDTAEDGKTALSMIMRSPYDLVILDCQMPEMDGYEVCRIIRQSELATGKRVPVVAMTANAMVGDREKCMDSGMDDYVTKPINGDRMMEVLVKWLQNGTPTQELKTVAATTLPSRVKHIKPLSDIPVDMEYLRSFIGDDDQEKSLVLGMFVKGAEESISVLSQNIDTGDVDAWKRAAHKLKGSAANFGANYLRDCCVQAEELSDANPIDKAQLLHMVQQAYDGVKNYMTN